MFKIRIAILSSFLLASTSLACDLCSIYNSVQSRIPLENSWHLGVAQQFTDFGTLRERGSKVDNDEHQRLTSLNMQLLLGYDQTDRLSYQISLPFITRHFSRFTHDGDFESGKASGVGDLSLISRYAVINKRTDDSIYILQLIGGIKLPTGDAHRLGEEGAEETEHSIHHADAVIKAHGDEEHETPRAIHGHDLALGTGSIDFPIGTTYFLKKGKVFFSGDIQYMIRNKGGFDYRHANDLTWSMGPGYFLKVSKETKFAPRAVLSGTYKGNDKNSSHEAEIGTSLNALYFGPEILVSTSYGFGGEVGFDLPVYMENSGVQAVPSSRIRAALNFQF
jgi:hypothetical protein